ncbi:MAG: DUF1080 domain-containing protein [Gemmatimonadota bacterium]|nr:DUF1080 domain-containing protein [Gemmatimonadota bacterium]
MSLVSNASVVAPPRARLAGVVPVVLVCAGALAGCGQAGATPNENAVAEAPAGRGSAQGSAQDPPANRLTPEEEADGWKLLFDGSLDGWRGYRRDDVPAGWQSRDGALMFMPGNRGGTIITVDQFADFELALEWKVSEGGNSGVFYRATEDEIRPYWTGPEMQVLDNAGHRDGATPETSAGSNYALHAPSEDVTRPVGEWNRARIIVRGAQVEHWMNGVRIVAYELWTDEWRALVQRSKFGEWPGYGMASAGHIGLQDHGDPVWFRNIKIRTF